MNISRRNFFSLFGAAAVASVLPMPLKALTSTFAPAVEASSPTGMAMLAELMRAPAGRAKLAEGLTLSINRRLNHRRRWGRRCFGGDRLPMALKPGEEIPYEYALRPEVHTFEANTSLWDIKQRRFDIVQRNLHNAMNRLIENEHALFAASREKGEAFVPMPVEVVSVDSRPDLLIGFHLRQQYAVRD